jgi:hypothetical protein
MEKAVITIVTVPKAVYRQAHFPLKTSNFLYNRASAKRMSAPTSIAARCLCCGFRTISKPEAFELCEVCWWQDDGQDDSDADEIRGTVNGKLSLSGARRNFKSFGAADERFVSHVRAARADEL